mmetsp:Transcript_16332/g.34469  ORF Transcript_16332/g.34469 Transcript_16332/m.34469 type:complete len:253 (+) Transcript_16332:104-862(+)
MDSSVASSRVGRNTKKYNIAPEFLTSPYLSKPIGFDHEKKRRSGENSGRRTKSTGRRRGDSDAESVASFRTHRTNRTSSSYRTQQTYRRPGQSSASRMASMKNFLLPREMEKLLRGFRQKHSNHPIMRGQSDDDHPDHEDDSSTIASDSAESLDDKAVYMQCRKKGDDDVMNSLFSGPLFAEITWNNCNRVITDGPVFNLPPVGTIDNENDKSGDISDLESLHSSASKLLPSGRPHTPQRVVMFNNSSRRKR